MSNGTRKTFAELLIIMQGNQQRRQKLLKERRIAFLESASRLPINKDNNDGPMMDGGVRVVHGSQSKPYYVSRNGNEYECTCPSFKFGSGGVDSNGRKTCKHIKASPSSRSQIPSTLSPSPSPSLSLSRTGFRSTSNRSPSSSSARILKPSPGLKKDPKVVSPSTVTKKRTGAKKQGTIIRPPKKRNKLLSGLLKKQQSECDNNEARIAKNKYPF